MPDTLSPAERSERMSRIRSKNSSPELKLRSLIHAMGFRYRLHVKELPGTPDLVFPSRKAVIFLHGCYWHRHEDCKLARLPKTKLDFWKPKLDGNKARDMLQQQQLRDLGWRVLIVWDCEMVYTERIAEIVRNFLCESDGE